MFEVYEGKKLLFKGNVDEVAKFLNYSTEWIYFCAIKKREVGGKYKIKRVAIKERTDAALYDVMLGRNVVMTRVTVREIAKRLFMAPRSIYNCIEDDRATSIGYSFKRVA